MTLAELQTWLATLDWFSAFDPGSLQRGRAYATRGHVRKLQLLDSGLLQGRIKGSGQHYTCLIMLMPRGARLGVSAHCSCPVGSNCKHAAAMLFDAATSLHATGMPATPGKPMQDVIAQRQAAIELGRWEQWLASLDKPRNDATAPKATADQRFGLLLRGADHQLLVLPAWLRPAKSSTNKTQWVAPQPVYNAFGGPQPAPLEGWSDEDAFALSALLTAPSVSLVGHHWLTVRSRAVEYALQLLLARHNAWFERGEHPLEAGPELAATLGWTADAEGNQRLGLQIDSPGIQLLQGANQLWYVDVAAGHYGRVAGDLSLYHRLQGAPVLAPGQVDAVRQRIAASAVADRLPPPRELGQRQRVQVQPEAVLHLQVIYMQRGYGPKRPVGYASLHFDYAGQRIAQHEPRATLTRRSDEGLLEIARDTSAESRWIAAVSQAGLIRKDDLDILDILAGAPVHAQDWFPKTRKPQAALAPEAWAPLLVKLAKAGFHLEYAADFPHDELVTIDDWHAELEPSGNAWFDVSLGVDVAGERIDLLPVLRQLVADPDFPRVAKPREKKSASWRVKLDEQRAVDVPLAQLRSLIEPLLEWLETEHDGAPRVHATQLGELGGDIAWHGGEALRDQLQQLRSGKQTAKPPRGFKATLRPYQQDGLAWLDFLAAAKLGGILADDMGLGKTVQVLAHILGMKQRKQLAEPALVVCPTSLVGNWQMEAARFAPTLKVLVLHGADRAERYDAITAHELVITTYPLLPRDRDKLVEASFSLLVLDEAQAIKNAASQAAQVVREIPAARRLAMTGTPLENHLGELWAQFDAVEPGLLGSQRQFAKVYRTPIEKHGDVERQQRLNRRVGALMLRRRKRDVLTDLPEKTEIVHTLELEDEQRALYETLRLAQHERVRQAVAERGLAQSGIIVLDALLKLRQACCDPRLVKLASAKKVKSSAKLDALLELLDGLLADGRRVLLFSQFTEMLALIEAALTKRKLAFQTLTGQTPARERTAMVKCFQDGELPLFLISLKAGGVGLNLTAADTVIHYDPWWNPAVEAQATDRAHRIGQKNPVFVYRLICAGTVEEKIQAMQGRKAELARAVLEGGGATAKLRFDEGDLDALFGAA